MPARQFNEEAFVQTYRMYGTGWTWGRYAEVLGVTHSCMRRQVASHRERWEEQYEIHIPRRRVNAKAEFSSWPALPSALRNTKLYKTLLVAAVLREDGQGAVKPWMAAYVRLIQQIRDRNEVIRFDPERQSLYRDGRTLAECADDPNHIRIYESEAAYLARTESV